MILTVPLIEGVFVLDPGFGVWAPRVPLPLVDGAKVESDGAQHWMAREGTEWVHRIAGPDRTLDAWVTTLEDETAIDFELGNHFTATHPSSPFRNLIMMRALTPDGRVTVMNRDATIRRGGDVEKLQLADRAALRRLLADYFGFDLPETETLRVPAIPEWT
jgi:N-hydroxyarylamine O-acetyltransferase